MTVNAIYRELTNTNVKIIESKNVNILYKGMENDIPVELMDRQVVIMRVMDNQLVITVH